ncbi:MAG: PLD nuclease N-terminal domain-containing protein [Oscillospiraceae bacterium]|nr:PLD nuclease N-terminal domain-containing protein [Oscillospiraceae bacterium]
MNITINTDFAAAWVVFTSMLWLFIPILMLWFILLVAALISIARKDVPGMEKLPWIILVVLVSTFGPIIYFVIGSGHLDKKAAEREDDR